MDYSNIFSYMQAEVTLIAVIVLLFLYDLIAGERGRRRFSAVACGLLAARIGQHRETEAHGLRVARHARQRLTHVDGQHGQAEHPRSRA